MRQQRHTNTGTSLFSVGTSSTKIQIVATCSGLLLDLQAENIGTDGHIHRSHAVAKLPIDVAMPLQTALKKAIDAAWGIEDPVTEASEPRQTAMWSQSTLVPRRKAA
jgi:hypothetical protein